VVTLDPKEKFCGCGGVGHLEDFLGLSRDEDAVPGYGAEEVFANAKRATPAARNFAAVPRGAGRRHRQLRSYADRAVLSDGSESGFIDVGLLDGWCTTW